jgi:hypothetical protein
MQMLDQVGSDESGTAGYEEVIHWSLSVGRFFTLHCSLFTVLALLLYTLGFVNANGK